jgi:hypothetical protein
MKTQNLLFALLIALSSLATTADVASPSGGHSIGQVYSELESLFRKYYSHATVRRSSRALHIEYATRHFMVHEPLKSGEWQDAREVLGPDRGGIVCDIEEREGKYLGAAVVPQTFDKRYFALFVAAPESKSRGEHLYVHLLYPPDARPDFLERFTKIVEGFAD